jgi:hypothetical protein
MADRRETEQLREAQREREETEERLARGAADPEEAAQHQRRAEKSRYLRDKLEERAASERRAD